MATKEVKPIKDRMPIICGLVCTFDPLNILDYLHKSIDPLYLYRSILPKENEIDWDEMSSYWETEPGTTGMAPLPK